MTIKLEELLRHKSTNKEHWLNRIFVAFSKDEDNRLIDQDEGSEIPLAPLPSQFKVKAIE